MRGSANTLFRRKKIMATLCGVLFIISATIIVALVLGQEAGSFVIRVQDNNLNKSIQITYADPILIPEGETRPDENNPSPTPSGSGSEAPVNPTPSGSDSAKPQLTADNRPFRETYYFPEDQLKNLLKVDAVSNFTDYSPSYFLADGYKTIDEYSRPRYEKGKKNEKGLYTHSDDKTGSTALFCYTFYIVNTGAASVDVNLSMSYSADGSKGDKEIDEIARIMTYVKSPTNDEEATIYYKRDSEYHVYDTYPDIQGLTLENFPDRSHIFNDQKVRVDYETGYIRYSVVFWLEGDDPDSSKYGDDFYGSTMDFSLHLEVVNNDQ